MGTSAMNNRIARRAAESNAIDDRRTSIGKFGSGGLAALQRCVVSCISQKLLGGRGAFPGKSGWHLVIASQIRLRL